MRNLQDIFDCYFDKLQRPIVLATLFSVDGSHVYRPGALMALSEDGAMFGSISAGCLEDDISSHALSLFASGGSKMIHYGAEDVSDNVFGLGLGCGGSVCILIERLPDVRETSHLFHLKYALEQQAECICVTLWKRDNLQSINAPQRAVFLQGECLFQTLGSESTLKHIAALARRHSTTPELASQYLQCDEGRSEALMTIHRPQLSLTVYGSGEIATALERVATFLHWNVSTIEPQASEKVASVDEERDNGVAVLLTHNDSFELQLLQELLPSAMTYVGVLGSRSRIERIVTELQRSHPCWTNEYWEKLHAPVGLAIGSESPQEIALSIVAEILAVSNRRDGRPLRKSLKRHYLGAESITESTTCSPKIRLG